MTHRLLPFIKSKKAPVLNAGTPVALESKGPKKSDDGKIVDHGKLGDLEYEIFDRGVIHIFDKDLKFKKDIYAFEDEVKTHNFKNMSEGSFYEIKGSGDNDHLVFTKENGDIKISLKKRDFEAIGLLQSVLSKGKQKLAGGA